MTASRCSSWAPSEQIGYQGRKPAVLAVLAALFFLGATAVPAGPDGEKLFQKRCAACHKLPDPTVAPPDGWPARVARMGKFAQLKPEQQQAVLDYILAHSQTKTTQASLQQDRELFEAKCSRCHTLDRIFLEPLSGEALQHVVESMQQKAGPEWLSDADVGKILGYLATARGEPRQASPLGADVSEADIFRARCTACHNLERIKLLAAQASSDNALWSHVVARMRQKAPQWISEEEAQSILHYLQTAETPGAEAAVSGITNDKGATSDETGVSSPQ